jgi:hypothetical protein
MLRRFARDGLDACFSDPMDIDRRTMHIYCRGRVTIVLLMMAFLLPCCSTDHDNKRIAEYNERVRQDTLSGVYIPRNLEECILQLDSFWSDSIRAIIKGTSEYEFTVRSHLAIGMWIRNNWGLWRGSRLSVYFNNLGIFHPDDMSDIILTSYHRRLSGRHINVSGQIRFYQEYWKMMLPREEKFHRRNRINKLLPNNRSGV